jgi:cytochrome P450
LRAWSLAILSALEPAPGGEILDRGNRAVREFVEYLRQLVAERRNRPGNPESDVLTRLLQGESDGARLTESELYHNCIFLLNAGHETTTNLIGNGMWLLLANPAETRSTALRPGADCERRRRDAALRRSDPAQQSPPLAADGSLAASAAGRHVHHDCHRRGQPRPAQFPEAERFDVGRNPNRHVAFGQGAHACAGMNVARMEARIAFTRLLARFADIEPAASRARPAHPFSRLSLAPGAGHAEIAAIS